MDKNTQRKVFGRCIALLIVLIAILGVWAFWKHLEVNPMSEDATIGADVVHISTPVPGRVQEFYVKDGSRVKKGDLLFTLDPVSYRLRVEQAEAELAMAEDLLDARQRQIRAETKNSHIADEQITRARTNLDLAERTLQRLLPLSSKGYVTRQQIDDAMTLKKDAQVSLNQALAQADAAQELIGKEGGAQAAVRVASAAVALAKKALSDTEVYAPHDGLIVGLRVSTGEYVAPDQSLFTLINTDTWFTTAFYRETDLSAIRVGACATVYIMGQPDTPLQGTVENIGWGISSTDMISLPRGLPYVEKSLNWVRVAQRFPVRITLTQPAPANLLRVGASANVVVRDEQHCEK